MGFLSEIKKVFTKEYKEETKRQESEEVFLKNNVDKFKFSGDSYDVHETIDRLKKAEVQTEFKQKIEVFDAAIIGDKQKAENFKKEMNKFVKSRDDEDEIER